MPRLFVAIRPPPHVCEALCDATNFGIDAGGSGGGGLESSRWQDDEQLHLTLRFIGEVEEHMVEDVATTLSDVRAPAIKVGLSQVGAFDRRGRIESLWIGAQPRDVLANLHRKVDHALVRLGLPAERRAYLPHVTLARFGRSGGDCAAWIAANAGLIVPRFTATAFELVESHLGREGALYDTIARFPLGGPSTPA